MAKTKGKKGKKKPTHAVYVNISDGEWAFLEWWETETGAKKPAAMRVALGRMMETEGWDA